MQKKGDIYAVLNRKLSRGDLVEILWIDSFSISDGWISSSELDQTEEGIAIISVGILWTIKKDFLVIVGSVQANIDEDVTTVRNELFIPLCSILSISRLKETQRIWKKK